MDDNSWPSMLMIPDKLKMNTCCACALTLAITLPYNVTKLAFKVLFDGFQVWLFAYLGQGLKPILHDIRTKKTCVLIKCMMYLPIK